MNIFGHAFPKHIREIFRELLDLLEANDFVRFISFLIDNVKNLAVRVHLNDKKQEKAMLQALKLDLQESQSESLLDRLQWILFEECNGVYLG